MKIMTKMEKLFFSKTNIRSDLQEDLWLNEFKKFAVALSEPISLGEFAPQALYQREDYLETATFLSVNELSAEQGCDLFNKERIKYKLMDNEIFFRSALMSERDVVRKNQTRLTPNKTCFLTRLRDQSLEGLEVEWNHSVDGLLKFLMRKGKLKKGVRIAGDCHDDPFYGDPDSDYVHKGRAKHGTNYFLRYITCCICVAGYRIKLGMKMLKKKENPLEWLRAWLKRLLEIGLKIEWVLLDRGFYSISTCKMIDEFGLDFLMAAKKTNPMKELTWEYFNKTIPSHHQYIIKNAHDEFKGTVIFATEEGNLNSFRRTCQNASLPAPKIIKKIWTYFTNKQLPSELHARLCMIREIPGIYKSRWGIETSYKMLDKFHVPSSSKIPVTRYFLYIFQAIMYNCWVVTNLILTLHHFIKKKGLPRPCDTFKFEIRMIWTQVDFTSQKPPPSSKKSSLVTRIKNFFRRDQN